MSRRTHPCRHCNGRTRHNDRRCSACRNNPVAWMGAIGRAAYDAMRSMRLTDWQQAMLEARYREHVAASLASTSHFVQFQGGGA